MAAVTAPVSPAPPDTGRWWYTWRRWWDNAPGRWAHTPFRRATLILALVAAVAPLDDIGDRGPLLYLAGMAVVYVATGALARAWAYQLHEARTEPTPPPEPVYTTILATPWDADEVTPHKLAGFDRVAAGIVDHARQLGLDVNDPYTLCVLDAAVVMALTYAERRPVTPDAAMRIHDAVWRHRLIEHDRRGPAPSTGPE